MRPLALVALAVLTSSSCGPLTEPDDKPNGPPCSTQLDCSTELDDACHDGACTGRLPEPITPFPTLTLALATNVRRPVRALRVATLYPVTPDGQKVRCPVSGGPDPAGRVVRSIEETRDPAKFNQSVPLWQQNVSGSGDVIMGAAQLNGAGRVVVAEVFDEPMPDPGSPVGFGCLEDAPFEQYDDKGKHKPVTIHIRALAPI